MQDFKTKLGKGGRIVIPTEYRRELGVEPGDEIILHLDEGGIAALHFSSRCGAVASASIRGGEAKIVERVGFRQA